MDCNKEGCGFYSDILIQRGRCKLRTEHMQMCGYYKGLIAETEPVAASPLQRGVINREFKGRLKMDIEKVKKLTEIFHNKRLTFETLGIMGQSHDPDERKKQTVEYEVARAEMMEARRNLDKEQGL